MFTLRKIVESGMFGCVRSHGHRLHEGIDIKCLERDRHGEPTDPVHAVADGTVAFINGKPGLSNYGRYIVLEHRWDGVTVHTLYAHLSAIADGLAAGQPVRKAQVIATLGHSTNTRERIPADRAHLHFEINLLLKHCREPFKTFVLTAVLTGMRKAELLGLQWGDIDLGSLSSHAAS